MSDVLLKSCLDLSVGLVEQQVGMTDIHLPRCVCVFPLILEPINSISDLRRSVYTAAVEALIGRRSSCASPDTETMCCVAYRGSGCQRTVIRYLEVMNTSGLVSGR